MAIPLPPGCTLGASKPEDLEAIRALLDEAGLPLEGVEALLGEDLVVVEVGGEIAAAAGLERYGRLGLLRSVVVAPARRGARLGALLVEDRLAWARSHGVDEVYLLTLDAAGFFAAHGFRELPREAAPEAIRGSAEFAEICPESAVLMGRRT